MAIILTTSYQAIASGTKDFNAGGYSQTAKQTIYAMYESINAESMTAIIKVKATLKSNKSGYSWTSSGNTQKINVDGVAKQKGVSVGTVNTTEKTMYETTFEVKYNEDGIWENKTIGASIDCYSNYIVSANGAITLPPIDVSNVHVGVGEVVRKAQAYVGVGGIPTKCEVYLGKDGTPVKCA